MFFREGGGFVGAITEKERPELVSETITGVYLLAHHVLGQHRDKGPEILIKVWALLGVRFNGLPDQG
jgi:hypothetical protein